MARPHEDGEDALYEYQRVSYNHFGTPPGDALLLTADPWSYLDAWLQDQISSSRGANKKAFTRARFFAELARGFYEAAETASLPTKGTLVYYGMLNLAKCLLATRRLPLEEQIEHHGLTIPSGGEGFVRVSEHATTGLNVFHEFADALGTPVLGKADYKLQTICSHIPEIHEITFALGHVPGKRRLFLPVRIVFKVNSARNRLFAEIQYEKKNEARVQISRFYKGERESYFRDLGEIDGWHVFRSEKRRQISRPQWPRAYKNFCAEFEKFELASILTHEGYRYYVDLGKPDFHHLAWTLMLTFYIGSIARYRPVAAERLMDGPLRPLVSEALAVCPRQFLYQLTSLITSRACSVPHSSLI